MPRFTGLGSGNRLSLGLGRSKAPPAPAQKARIQATGGTLSVVGSYNVHTFTTTGTFTVDFTGSTDKLVEVLVVGGGGGGGFDQGGGGGGSEIITSSWQVTSPSASYLATVGGGGGSGGNGSNSTIGVITGTANPTNYSSPVLVSRFGRQGGNRNQTPPAGGACGGGAGGRDPTATSAGTGWYLSRAGGGSGFQSAGGGGGHAGNGTAGTSSINGNGGAGSSNSIRTGAAQIYGAGGGGGGSRPAPLTVQYSTGGSSNIGGRGARGQWTFGCSGQTAGVAESGSGGGGGLGDGRAISCGQGTQGGGGVVVFRYIRNT